MNLEYVLITPAHNEEAFIEKTLSSVIQQTILPRKWVVVSDGSTDHTEEIVEGYAGRNDWIELVRMPERKERHFAGKAYAFNAGCEKVKSLTYDVIGNLDADISFEEDFFEYLLDKFQKDPRLGVTGTDYIEGSFHSFKNSYINVHHVNGQCQLFRRGCFEQIGGYIPIKEGAIDWVAVTMARMKGWKTYSFPDRTYIHHRRMGTANSNELKARFQYGKKDYFCGGHPLWQIFRATFQASRKPYLMGGACLLSGYLWAWLTQMDRPIPKELIYFHRQEQMQRLKNLLANRFRMKRSEASLINRPE